MKMYGLKTKAPEYIPEAVHIHVHEGECMIDTPGVFVLHISQDTHLVHIPVPGICHLYLEIESPNIEVNLEMRGRVASDSDIYHSITTKSPYSKINLFGRVFVESGTTIYRSLCSDEKKQAHIIQDVAFLRGVTGIVITEPAISIEHNSSTATHSVSVQIPDKEVIFFLSSCGLSDVEAYNMYTYSFIG